MKRERVLDVFHISNNDSFSNLGSLGFQLRRVLPGVVFESPGESQSSQLANRSVELFNFSFPTFLRPPLAPAPGETRSLGLYSKALALFDALLKASISAWEGIVLGIVCIMDGDAFGRVFVFFSILRFCEHHRISTKVVSLFRCHHCQ